MFLQREKFLTNKLKNMLYTMSPQKDLYYTLICKIIQILMYVLLSIPFKCIHIYLTVCIGVLGFVLWL